METVADLIVRANTAKETDRFLESLWYMRMAYSLCPREELE